MTKLEKLKEVNESLRLAIIALETEMFIISDNDWINDEFNDNNDDKTSIEFK